MGEFENLQPLGYGIATTFFILTTITIILRVYSRVWLVKSFGMDDWLMFSIFFFNIGQQALLYLFLEHGGGLHASKVSVSNLTLLPKMLFAEEIYYIWMHFIIKLCFLFFYLRLSQEQNFKRWVYAAMGLDCAITLGIWLLYCLQCFPLAAFWDAAHHPNASCIPAAVTYFIPAALHITMDFIILGLPIPTLWKLKVSLRRKLSLLSVVGFGGCSVLISILRLIVLYEFYSNPDFTYILGKMIIVSSLEIEVAIIAANMPAMKSIWIKHVRERGSASGSSHRLEQLGHKTAISTGKRSYGTPLSKTTADDKGNVNILLRNDSEEQLFDTKKITVTSSVGMTWTDSGEPAKGGSSTPLSRASKTYYQFDK